MMCSEVRLSLGVYVLGAIDHEEATRVEEHLERCPDCAAELAELSGLPPLLGRVSAEDVIVAARPPRAVLDRLVASTARRQRRSRFLLTAAASIVAVTMAGSIWMVTGRVSEVSTNAGSAASAPSAATAPAETKMEDSSGATLSSVAPQATPAPQQAKATPFEVRGKHNGVVMELALTPGAGGTVVGIEVAGVPEGTRCSLIAVDRTGAVSPIASWRVTRVDYQDGRAHFPPGSTEFTIEEIQRFELLSSSGQRLVTIKL